MFRFWSLSDHKVLFVFFLRGVQNNREQKENPVEICSNDVSMIHNQRRKKFSQDKKVILKFEVNK